MSVSAIQTCAAATVCLAALAIPPLAVHAQAPAPKPHSDLLIFKNGDQLTGTLERGVGNSIVFKSDMAGEITVSLDNVKELRAYGDFAVLKKDVPVKRGAIASGPLTYTHGAIAVDETSSSATQPVVPENSIAFLVDRPTFDRQLKEPRPWRGWTGAANASVTDVQSTNYGTTFNLALNLARVIPAVAWLPPRNRTTFNVAETYGELTQPVVPQTTPATPNSVAKTNILHVDFERDQYISPRFYALGDLALDHNYAQGLTLQQVYGAGFGWTPLQNPRQQLDLKVDVHYESQKFQPTLTTNTDQNLIGSTFSESYRRNLPRKIVLTELGSVLPAWNNPNAYSATGSINFALPAFKRITVTFGVSDSFLNDPSPGFLKNSFQLNTGFGYTF